MANQPYIHLWKQPKINYRLIGKNGEVLYQSAQGFERIAGAKKNLSAILYALSQNYIFPTIRTIKVKFFDSRRAKTVNKEEVWTI